MLCTRRTVSERQYRCNSGAVPQRTTFSPLLKCSAAFIQLYLVEDVDELAASVLQHASELVIDVRSCGKRASWSLVVAQLLLSTMLRQLLAVAAALGAVALLPPTHARPPRRLRSAVAAPELSKEEAGHLLGYGYPSHEPSTLQQIDAACVARADALTANDLQKLEEQIKAIDAELGPPVSPSGNVRRDSDGKDVVAVAAAPAQRRRNPRAHKGRGGPLARLR